MKIEDQITVHGSPSAWKLKTVLPQFLAALKKGKWVSSKQALILNVSIVGKARIRRLNREFLKVDKPTDVLSFEQPAISAPVRFLGDLVICAEVARAQAKQHGHGVQDELAVLIAHGLLHLLGFDHEKSKKHALDMAKAEQKLLKLAGFNPQTAGLIHRTSL